MDENPFYHAAGAGVEEKEEDEDFETESKKTKSKSKAASAGAVRSADFADVESPLGPASLERNIRISECLDGLAKQYDDFARITADENLAKNNSSKAAGLASAAAGIASMSEPLMSGLHASKAVMGVGKVTRDLIDEMLASGGKTSKSRIAFMPAWLLESQKSKQAEARRVKAAVTRDLKKAAVASEDGGDAGDDAVASSSGKRKAAAAGRSKPAAAKRRRPAKSEDDESCEGDNGEGDDSEDDDEVVGGKAGGARSRAGKARPSAAASSAAAAADAITVDSDDDGKSAKAKAKSQSEGTVAVRRTKAKSQSVAHAVAAKRAGQRTMGAAAAVTEADDGGDDGEAEVLSVASSSDSEASDAKPKKKKATAAPAKKAAGAAGGKPPAKPRARAAAKPKAPKEFKVPKSAKGAEWIAKITANATPEARAAASLERNARIARLVKALSRVVFDKSRDEAAGLTVDARSAMNYKSISLANASVAIAKADFPILSGVHAKCLTGVGESTAALVDEVIATGRLADVDEEGLDDRASAVRALCRLPGLDAAAARRLVDEAGIATVEQLQEAAASGTLPPGLLPPTAQAAVRWAADLTAPLPRDEAAALLAALAAALAAGGPTTAALQLVPAGAFRRGVAQLVAGDGDGEPLTVLVTADGFEAGAPEGFDAAVAAAAAAGSPEEGEALLSAASASAAAASSSAAAALPAAPAAFRQLLQLLRGVGGLAVGLLSSGPVQAELVVRLGGATGADLDAAANDAAAASTTAAAAALASPAPSSFSESGAAAAAGGSAGAEEEDGNPFGDLVIPDPAAVAAHEAAEAQRVREGGILGHAAVARLRTAGAKADAARAAAAAAAAAAKFAGKGGAAPASAASSSAVGPGLARLLRLVLVPRDCLGPALIAATGPAAYVAALTAAADKLDLQLGAWSLRRGLITQLASAQAVTGARGTKGFAFAGKAKPAAAKPAAAAPSSAAGDGGALASSSGERLREWGPSLPARTEEDVFAALGLPFVPPEGRIDPAAAAAAVAAGGSGASAAATPAGAAGEHGGASGMSVDV